MAELRELSVNQFVEETASKASVPGGGSVSAMVGALGAALMEMVANLTIGKEKYAGVQEEMQVLAAEGAALHEDEWQQLLTKIKQLPADCLLVLSGSLPPNMNTSAINELLQCAKDHGLRTVVDSSGDALKTAVNFGGLELIKPNQSELAELTGQTLEQPDQVVNAARQLIAQGAAKRIVVSLGPQGALGVDAEQCVQVVPPPVIKRSTVGAGDSMVGAMVMKLAAGADLTEMVRFGVAAGTAATMNQGTKLCNKEDTERLYQYLNQPQ